MKLKRSTNEGTADDVSSEERLADYTVTRTYAPTTTTGLPPVELPQRHTITDPLDVLDAGEAMMVTATTTADGTVLRPVIERRRERRRDATLSVVATYTGSDVSIEGVTRDISPSGMCLVMPEPPSSLYQDAVVVDGDRSSCVWVQVLRYQVAPQLGYLWHVRVNAADDEWSRIVAGPAAVEARVIGA